MSIDEIRALLLKRAKPFAKRKGSTGLKGWAAHHGIPPSRTSEVIHGKRLPNPAMLDALGLEWRIVRKRKSPLPGESGAG